VDWEQIGLDGPYESYPGNPILTQRTLPPSRPDPITSTGHADFVETQNSEWWALALSIPSVSHAKGFGLKDGLPGKWPTANSGDTDPV